MQGQSKRVYIFSGLALLVILALALAFNYWSNTGGEPGGTIVYTPSNNANAVLTKENPTFAQAEATLKAGDTRRALELYRQALSGAQDTVQRGQIEYKIARAEEKSGDYIAAISDFKKIIANPAYPRILRAYAAMYMGEMYYTYYGPTVMTETFKDPPYSTMVDKNPGITYRHLFEYTSSLYPLALAEARIADWYAQNLHFMYTASSSPPQDLVDNNMRIINDKLANVDRDLRRMDGDANTRYDIPPSLQRKAVVLGRLALLKKASPDDAEKAFKDAMAIVDTLNVRDAYIPLTYAIFLSHFYGEERRADIQRLLSSIYDGGYAPTSVIVEFLKYAQTRSRTFRGNTIDLANIDPKFKAYLTTLGWTEADFK